MRWMIEQTELVAAGESWLHVLQSVHRPERQTLIPQSLQSALFGAERDRIGAACQPIGQLPPIAGDHGFLIDKQPLDEILAKLNIKLRGLVAPGPGYCRIHESDSALPFGIQEVAGDAQFFRFDLAWIDRECPADGI